MKTQFATSQNQSSRLLQCGVSADTADMHRWVNSYGQEFLETYRCPSPAVSLTPAWSLGALLSNVLPKHLDDFPFTQWIEPFSDGEICEIEDNDEHVLSGDVKLSYEENAWIVDYDWDGFTGVLPNSDNPIEACVRAIELLYANGYKLNEQ